MTKISTDGKNRQVSCTILLALWITDIFCLVQTFAITIGFYLILEFTPQRWQPVCLMLRSEVLVSDERCSLSILESSSADAFSHLRTYWLVGLVIQKKLFKEEE